MPQGNLWNLINTLSSAIYQLLTAWFYNYKMFLQVGWIINFFILKCNILDLKKNHFPFPCMVHQVPPCQHSRGKDRAPLTQTVNQPLLKIKEKAEVRLNCPLLPELCGGEKTSPAIFTDIYWLQRNNEQQKCWESSRLQWAQNQGSFLFPLPLLFSQSPSYFWVYLIPSFYARQTQIQLLNSQQKNIRSQIKHVGI